MDDAELERLRAEVEEMHRRLNKHKWFWDFAGNPDVVLVFALLFIGFFAVIEIHAHAWFGVAVDAAMLALLIWANVQRRRNMRALDAWHASVMANIESAEGSDG